MSIHHCRIIATLVFALAITRDLPASDTVDGPETRTLVNQLKGYLLTDNSGDITSIALPQKESRLVYHPPRRADGMGPTIHSFSGPDHEGRVVYVEDYFFVDNEKDRRHKLKAIRLDGTGDVDLFTRPGDAMWATSASGHGEIGSYLALAPEGGRVAFISRTKNRQMPRALLTVGHVEIWSVADKTGYATDVAALDEPMSWFPDGRRIAYAALVKRENLPKDAPWSTEASKYFGNAWDEVPAIYVLDVDTKKRTFFHVGWNAVVSQDGRSVLVGAWLNDDYHWQRINVDSVKVSPVSPAGIAGGCIAATDSLVIYTGLPTRGSAVKFTDDNSPLGGPKEVLTVKVSNDAGDQFQTLMPEIDPRNHASFGVVK